MKSNTLHGMEREKQVELHSERNEVNIGSSNGKPILADNVGLQDAFYSRFMHTSTLRSLSRSRWQRTGARGAGVDCNFD